MVMMNEILELIKTDEVVSIDETRIAALRVLDTQLFHSALNMFGYHGRCFFDSEAGRAMGDFKTTLGTV